ncbi:MULTISPECIES: glycosyltransferase family 1 protein [unclassified Lentimicrobium]|uniref:glycosyltransferase family 4 protein n=1 Tax=unclassified Lentimicrobium TaxID=2677434 RepID=UPI0015571B34|nr:MULTISPECIES: glycosyltransferase family 1 protein [unclassified Lentimicrobium]NPD45549.1 glycosyltransferase family 4 protein [Lentimicrobium sp. S6]NPD83628.1 glycosyltransferase family 4 protein [Lentimicrobium sp. L6]
MHIVFICDPIDKQTAGIFQYTLQVARHIYKHNTKYRITFVTIHSKFIDGDIPAVTFPNFIRFLSNDPIRQFITLPRYLNKLNPDVVVEPAHFGPFNLKKRIKRITIIHDLTPILFPHYHPFLSRFLQKLFLPGILKRADLIITNSRHTTRDVNRYCENSKRKTKTILLGKETFFKPSQNQDVLQKYKIDAPYILNVGTLEPRKNLLTLLEAYAIYRKSKSSNNKLVIIGGGGWMNEKFDKAIANHANKRDIICTGFVEREEMPALYSQSRAFVYPSLYEGFGLPLLEAMSCGAACIAANNSSLPEVGGRGALYFNSLNANDLAERMSLINNDESKREELIQLGIIQAAKFSWDRYAEDFLLAIEKLEGVNP